MTLSVMACERLAARSRSVSVSARRLSPGHLPDVVQAAVRPQIADGGSQGGLLGAARHGGTVDDCKTTRLGVRDTRNVGVLRGSSATHPPSSTIAGGIGASLRRIRHI